MVGTFFSASIYSMQAPFFPHEADQKGLTPSQYGFVFSVYEIMCMLMSPIIGLYVGLIGTYFLTTAGLFVAAITVMLFGTLVYVQSSFDFFVLAISIRVFESIGQTAYMISLISVITTMYPTSIAFRMSLNEMCFGAGMICGPAIGGFLYALGGFVMPFFTIGLILLLVVVVSVVFIPTSDLKNKSKKSPLALSLKCLTLPRVYLALIVLFSISLGVGFLFATLEPKLRQFKLKPQILGLIFTISPGIYMCTSPLFGWFMDKGLDQRICIICGLLMRITGYSLIGPLPVPALEFSIPLAVAGLLLQGCSNGAIVNATLLEVLKATNENINEPKETLNGIASGIFQSAFSVGMFVGPIFGGYMLETLGFQWGLFIITALTVFAGCILTVAFLYDKSRNRIRTEESISLL